MKNKNLSRRQFLKITGLTAGSIALTGCHKLTQCKRPNILIIHVDQHRIDCLGSYGNPDIKTPNMDKLAADGVRYNNNFCCFPVCTPSRYSLISGLYVHEHSGWNNRSTLAPKFDTFPKILKVAGYKTKAVGKMHYTPTYLDVGFQKMILSEQDGPGRWDDDYHRYLMKNNLVDRNDLEDQLVKEYRSHAPKEYWDTFGAMVSNLPEKHHSTTWIGDQAIKEIQSWKSSSPNLLMAGFIKPHHPFDPPAPWHKMYDPEKLSLLPGWTDECLDRNVKYSIGYFDNRKLTKPALQRIMAYYYASISQIDHHVGRMITLLKQKKLYDNTLIIYTADHGEFMGHHHMILKANYMYEPLIKIPLIIKWPGNLRAGTVSDSLVNNIDIAPTLCRAVGCKPSLQMHGNDLSTQSASHDIIFAECGGQTMARTKTRKLILANPPRENLYFDLQKDRLELDNLYNSPRYRDEIKVLEIKLNAWRCKEPKVFVDHNAPQINQPNVPPLDLSHRPAIQEYYRKKMFPLQGRSLQEKKTEK
ncbi:MAG: sulfatase-like hydrolase/transferase [Planctomycetota bacterium]|jgi:arylsulfatase A-like enzyme